MASSNRAIVRGIADTFNEAVAQYFGDGPTDVEAAKQQHEGYVNALRGFGVDVKILPTDNNFPDCCFVEDQVIICDGKGLLTVSGHDTRVGEQEVVANGISDDIELTKMKLPARMDGGDVMKFGDKYICGISNRTNVEAANVLREFVAPMGYTVHEIPVPSNALHFKSISSCPAPGVIIAPETFFTEDDFPKGTDLIWIPAEEVYAANTIAFGKTLLVPEGYPKTQKILRDRGFDLHAIDMSQIRAADGSLTCLSVFY